MALARHAARHPYDPWLFHPEPPEWRWISLADGLALVEGTRRSLVAGRQGDVRPGTVVAFRYLHEVSRLVADLAVQAGGLVSAPLSAGSTEDDLLAQLEVRGVGLWLGTERAGDAPPDGSDLPRRALEPTIPAPGSGSRGGVQLASERAASSAGVQVRDRAGRVHALSAEALVLAAEVVGAGLPVAAVGGAHRHVVLHWRPLADPGERVFVTWALGTGAAVVLVPEALGPLQALRWCRPTVLQGTGEELAFLASGLGEVEGGKDLRKLRRRFRRLSHVVVLDEPEDSGKVEPWRRFGATILGLPQLLRGRDQATGLHGRGGLADNIRW